MTTAAVPSTNPVDFLLNVETLDRAMNSGDLTFTDRMGNVKSTLAAAIDSIKAFNNRGAWAAITGYAGKDLVSSGGTWYVCVVAHTSSAAFATDTASKWRVYQGVTSAELAASSASSLVGFMPAGAGSVANTVQGKLRSFGISVLDKGAVPDGVTDCMQSVVNAANDAGAWNVRGPVTVHFPYVFGSANIYRIENIASLELINVTLDVDDGVQLEYYGGGPLAAASLRQTRAFPVREESINVGWVQGRPPAKYLAEKTDYLSPSDLDLSLSSVVDAAATGTKLLGWPGGALVNELTTGTVKTADTVTFTNRTVGGFSVATSPTKPGDEHSVYFSDSIGNVSIAVIGIGDRGYAGITAGTNSNSTTQRIETIDAVNVYESQDYDGTVTHPSYAPINSIWTIRHTTWDTIEILCNGVRVRTATIPGGQFRQVGFGCFPFDAVSRLKVNGFVKRTITAPSGSGKTLNIATFGDSITSDRADAWPRHMRHWLDTFMGVRVVEVANRAVSGDDIAGQWAAMNTYGVAGADYVVIQVGTNNIQVNTSAATFMGYLANMVAFARAAGAKVIIGIPPAFYGRDVAGVDVGQNTANSEKGTPIRMAILRYAAEQKIRVVDTLKLLGPVICNFINPALTPYFGGDVWNESMVFDNIHPSSVMEKLLGRAYAGAIAADYATNGSSQPAYSKEYPITVADAAWAASGSDIGNVKFEIDSAGVVRLHGFLTITPTSPADGTLVLTVPAGLIPAISSRQIVLQNANATCWIDINPTDRSIRVYSAPVGTYILYLSSMHWKIK